MLLWVDLETTGLHPRIDEIVEVAWTITKDDLSPHLLDTNSSLVRPTRTGFQRILDNDVVREMHEKSGLLDELSKGMADGTIMNLEAVEARIIEDIDAEVSESLVLAGSSIHFDRAFIDHWMPRLSGRLHYRLYDVSTLKAFYKSLGVDHGVDELNAHRAASDITHSLAVARAYRDAMKPHFEFLEGKSLTK